MSFKRTTITAAQAKAWEDTRTALLWVCPAFTHILYNMMDNASSEHVAVFTNDIPIAATDGDALLLNPEKFFAYGLQQRVFIVAHEIAHNMLNHIGLSHRFRTSGKVPFPDGSSLPFDHHTMNVAQDLIINDMLIVSEVGEFSADWLHDTSLGKHTDSSVDVYKKVFKQDNGGGKGKGKGKGQQFDQHLEPGAAGDGDPPPRNEQEWKTAVAAGMAIAKAQGKLPAGVELVFENFLKPEVSWSEHITSFFARKVGSGSYDWRRADRRLVVRDIYAPGRSGFGAGTVAVAIDTSGSIVGDPTLLTRFMGELAGILEDVQPRRTMVMWIDATVHAVDEVDEPGDIRALKPKGGGGTDFRPAFDWLTREGIEPDALVYLTDGYGSFPGKPPAYPVIWGNITKELKPTHYPFGDVVFVPPTSRS